MNGRIVIHNLGLLVMVIGTMMFAPLAWGLYYGETQAVWAFAWAIAVCVVAGGGMWLLTRRSGQEVFRKEALAIVGLGWLLTALVGALPFLFAGMFADERWIDRFANAYFESMSGFTTTGSTILTDITICDRSILFWRSQTHWLGGMGIIVLFVAVLPYLGAGGKHLYRTEAPGPVPEGLRPRIRHTATLLWKIYIAMTVAETLLLMVCFRGMPFDRRLFEALCHTFGTLATGGFSTHNESIAAYQSVSVELVIIVFMILAGINFSLHFRVRGGDWRAYHRDSECRVYLGLLLVATLFITFVLWRSGTHETLATSLRHGLFQVVAITTTTGYGTDDFNKWPTVTKLILVALMFVGASAGSTGGGFKIIRWMTLFKAARLQLERVFRPRTVRRVRIGKMILDDELVAANVTFLGIGLLVVVFGSFAMGALFLLCGEDVDLVTTVMSVIATLNNIGPGLERVGSIENYAFIPWPGKMLLSLCMAMGRLELYSILVLFVPSFWRSQ